MDVPPGATLLEPSLGAQPFMEGPRPGQPMRRPTNIKYERVFYPPPQVRGYVSLIFPIAVPYLP